MAYTQILDMEEEIMRDDTLDMETGPELLARLGDDHWKWAEAFVKAAAIHENVKLDANFVVGWFANAIESSWELRQRRAHKAALRFEDEHYTGA